MTTLFTLMTALGIDITPFQNGLGDADQTTKRTVPKITVTLDQVGQSAMRFGEHVMQVSGSLNYLGSMAEQSTNPLINGMGEVVKSAGSALGVIGNLSRTVGGTVNVIKDIGSAWNYFGVSVIPMVQNAIGALSTMTLPQLAAAIWTASAPLLPWIALIGVVIGVFVLCRDTIGTVVQSIIGFLQNLGGPFEWLGNAIQDIVNFLGGLIPSANSTTASMSGLATSANGATSAINAEGSAANAAVSGNENLTNSLGKTKTKLDEIIEQREQLLTVYNLLVALGVISPNTNFVSQVNSRFSELSGGYAGPSGANLSDVAASAGSWSRGNLANRENTGNIYDNGGNRASGGPVTAGMRYTVGEFGPEPFIPAVDGLILPNGFTGGQTNVTVVYQPMVSFADEEELARKLAPAIQNALRKAEAYG